MQIIKNIFGRIWAVWGLLLFVITMLIVFPVFCICFLWREPNRSFITHRIYHVWMCVYLTLIGVLIKRSGTKNFAKGENYIVVCNHNSLMDVPVSTPFMPGANKTIAKIEMSKIPVFGILYKLGSILVDRKDKDSRRNSFIQMKEVLDTGLHMCIYPEGTRNKTGEPLKEFHDGAFRLAVDTQKKIMIGILQGTKHILPNNKSFYLIPGLIKFNFLPPVEPGNDVEALKKKVFRMMWDAVKSKDKI